MSKDLALRVSNTDSRRSNFNDQQCSLRGPLGRLDKSSCSTLRVKLAFADSFLHGRLGSLLLKRLFEHACGRTAKLDEKLVQSLNAMVKRLQMGEAKSVKASSKQRWFIYIDACYESETKTGGLEACFWMLLENSSPGLALLYQKMCARLWAAWSKILL